MSTQIDLFTGKPVVCSVEKDPDKSGLEEMEDKLLHKYVKKVSAIIDHIDNIGLPDKGQQYRLVTRRSFNAVEFVQYVAKKEKILTLNMAIYSINYQAATILLDLVRRGKIAQVNIMMSNLRNKAHREKEEIIKEKFSSHPQITLFYCSSHAKMMACETKKGNFYTIEGSGNLAYNSRVEQYVIDNCEDVFNFSLAWMQEIKDFLKGKKELEVC